MYQKKISIKKIDHFARRIIPEVDIITALNTAILN